MEFTCLWALLFESFVYEHNFLHHAVKLTKVSRKLFSLSLINRIFSLMSFLHSILRQPLILISYAL